MKKIKSSSIEKNWEKDLNKRKVFEVPDEKVNSLNEIDKMKWIKEMSNKNEWKKEVLKTKITRKEIFMRGLENKAIEYIKEIIKNL
jgi:hypothetical protein